MRYLITLLFTITVFYNCDNTADATEVMVSSNFKSEMLAEINELRRSGCQCGNQWYGPVPALNWNALLEDAAMRHVQDMANHVNFNHQGTDGSTIDQRVSDTGYAWSSLGENIASGHTSIKGVVEAWKESPEHCINMMSPKFTEIGSAEKNHFWVQTFGLPR